MNELENQPVGKSPNQSMFAIGVVGAGQMGHGIAHVMLRAGHQVILLDTSQAFVDAGAKRILKGLARDVEKERLTEEQRQQAVARLRTTTVAADLAAADFIIEAVTEKFEVKAGVFRSLEPHCRPETIFASQHFFDFHHAPSGSHPAARQIRRPALFQSRAGHEAGGSGAGPANLARNRREGHRAGRIRGQDSGARERLSRDSFPTAC